MSLFTAFRKHRTGISNTSASSSIHLHSIPPTDIITGSVTDSRLAMGSSTGSSSASACASSTPTGSYPALHPQMGGFAQTKTRSTSGQDSQGYTDALYMLYPKLVPAAPVTAKAPAMPDEAIISANHLHTAGEAPAVGMVTAPVSSTNAGAFSIQMATQPLGHSPPLASPATFLMRIDESATPQRKLLSPPQPPKGEFASIVEDLPSNNRLWRYLTICATVAVLVVVLCLRHALAQQADARLAYAAYVEEHRDSEVVHVQQHRPVPANGATNGGRRVIVMHGDRDVATQPPVPTSSQVKSVIGGREGELVLEGEGGNKQVKRKKSSSRSLQQQQQQGPGGARHQQQGGKDGASRPTSSVPTDSIAYYILCMVGGILSAFPAIVVCPIDIVKVRLQSGVYSSFLQGIRSIIREAYSEGSTAVQNARRKRRPLAISGSLIKLVGECNNCTKGIAGRHGLCGKRSEAPCCCHGKVSSVGGEANEVSAYPSPVYVMFRNALSLISTATFSVSLVLTFVVEALNVLLVGWPPILIGHGLQGAIKYGIYEVCKNVYASWFPASFVLHNPIILFMLAAASAEFLADLFMTPFETMKVRLQMASRRVPFRFVFPVICRMEGIDGLYKTLLPLMCRQVPLTTIKFVAFEQIVRLLFSLGIAQRMSSVQVAILSGILAGIICATMTHPADTLVTKIAFLRSQGGASGSRGGAEDSKANAISVVAIVKQLGFKGLWGGLLPRLVMVAMMTAMQWAIYDGFKHAVGLPTSGKK
eukprot:GILI01014062.1.p1 GENE.GILI01014062.1~~GILI01014062.1.p1  ORF type:complete len:761 (-),score=91.11 GILI01014062.1:121-2403(-)